jgi:uncharacterized phiE125 gp8 family phage protein
VTTHLITPPTADVVALSEMKAHLNVDHVDDDAEIAAFAAAIASDLDAQAGWLGRALRPQTWEIRLDCFPIPCPRNRLAAIELPYPPFISIDSFKYDDVDGNEQILALDAGYRVLGFMAGDAPPFGKVRLAPPYGHAWPSARWDAETVRVRWQCGYAPALGAGQFDQLPPKITAWIKLVAATLYENRESVVSSRGGASAVLPDHIINMLSTLRVY